MSSFLLRQTLRIALRSARVACALLTAPLICSAQAITPASSQRASDISALFGGGTQSQRSGQSLTLELSIAEAFDHFVNADTITDTPFGNGGQYTTGSADFSYRMGGRRLQIAATGGSTGWYDPSEPDPSSASYYGAAGFAIEMRRRTQVFVNQSVSYDPWFISRLFPTPIASKPAEETAISDFGPDRKRGFRTYNTVATLSHGITRRGTLSATASYWKALLDSATTQTSYSIGGRFAYGLSRDASLHFGYGYRSGDFQSFGGVATSHDIDIGVDYNRALSFSRHTTVNFSVGSTLMRRPLFTTNTFGDPFIGSGENALDKQQDLQYSVTGNASLNHQIGRTWTAHAEYDRGILFFPGISQPVLSNSARAGLDGRLTHRTGLSSSFAYSNGSSVAIAGTSNFNAYTANARLQHALWRPWAAYVQYSYYAYGVPRNFQLVSGIPLRTKRSTVQVGMTLWFPLVGR